jgi:outer membrane protein OmpA-like peptidoglycan-associated protein
MARTTLLASTCALALAGASFADDEGYYAGVGVGIGMIDDLELTFDGAPNASVELDGESDAVELLSFGYRYTSGWRTEIEASHRFNELGAFNDANGTSDAHSWSLMANAIYDMNPEGVLSPYLGAGAGASQIVFSGQGEVSGVPLNVNDSDTVLAGQLIAGVGWRVSPRWVLDAGYRYLIAPEADFDGAELDSGYEHHDVIFGVRYLFGEPATRRVSAAPAAPPAPPTQPRVAASSPVCDDVDFLVYFEWDRADLTGQAESTIRNATAQASACGVTRIAVEGHTDRSGASAYNEQLSRQRASVVRDELIRAGVPASRITVEAKGESDLAVNTADGVREPLNRRSNVVIIVNRPTS